MRYKFLAAAIAVVVPLQTVDAWPAGQPGWVLDFAKGGALCTPLPDSANPIRHDVSFEGEIRTFLNGLCIGCHGSSGGLGLSASSARVNLLVDQVTNLETGRLASGQPSPPATPFLRVKPGMPEESMLFIRLNCDEPPVGSRMPIGNTATTEFQSLVHDWIAAGALMPDSPGADRIFVGSYEAITRPGTAP